MPLFRKVRVKTPEEIEKMREAGRIVARILDEIRTIIEPGVTTKQLEECAVEIAQQFGVRCAFYRYRGFPAHICTSINEEIVHGIPSERRVLREGDIVSVDVGIEKDGYFGDAAATYPVGEISPTAQRLITTTRRALDVAIRFARAGVRLSQLCASIEKFVITNHFNVVKDYVGHGIGRELHEEPPVPNYLSPNILRNDLVFRPGITLAIEPMVNEGVSATRRLDDGWTVVTRDGKLSAHFEHTVAITESEPLILTSSRF